MVPCKESQNFYFSLSPLSDFVFLVSLASLVALIDQVTKFLTFTAMMGILAILAPDAGTLFVFVASEIHALGVVAPMSWFQLFQGECRVTIETLQAELCIFHPPQHGGVLSDILAELVVVHQYCIPFEAVTCILDGLLILEKIQDCVRMCSNIYSHEHAKCILPLCPIGALLGMI